MQEPGTPAKKTATPKKSKAQLDKEKKEKQQEAEERKKKKDEADRLKNEAKLKKLAESKRKATARAEREELRRQADEIVNQMHANQQAAARDKYKELLEKERDSRPRSQPPSDQGSENTDIDPDNTTSSGHQSGSVPPADGDDMARDESVQEEEELDDSGRRLSPPGVTAKEPRKEGQKSKDNTRKERLQALNEKIREMETDNPDVSTFVIDVL